MAAPNTSSSGQVKKITWSNSEWRCEDVNMRLYRKTPKGQELFDGIDSDKITIKAEPDYLEMAAPPVKESGYWRIPLKVRDGVVVAPHWRAEPETAPTYFTAKKSNPRPEQPKVFLQIKVTVSCPISQALSATAQATAAAGLVPGGADVVSAALGAGSPVLSKVITYQVVPPKIKWHVDQPDPVRLCGAGGPQLSPDDPSYVPPGQGLSNGSLPLDSSSQDQSDPEDEAGLIRVFSDPLPPGWTDAVLVAGALAEASTKLQITAERFEEVPEHEPNVLSAYLSIKSGKLVLRPIDTLDDDKEPEELANIDWVVQTASRYLGTQVETVSLRSQPLEVSCYFRKLPKERHAFEPAMRFTWTGSTKVACAPSQGASRNTSKLILKLKSSRGWPVPQVHWYFQDEFPAAASSGGASGGHKLDDKLATPTLLDCTYTGPTKGSWAENGKPTEAPLVCMVGPEQRELAVGREHPDLYFAKPIEALVMLAGPRTAVLKVTLGPTKFVQSGVDLDLTDTAYASQALLKTFHINIEY